MPNLRTGTTTIPPGVGVESSMHNSVEVIVVLEGEGVALLGESVQDRAGDR
ncbi:MAG: hypothetical protein HY331_12645 [Chloroflexi bacterium]|nr:hypothetical protein [Chloroflexota bacterium]